MSDDLTRVMKGWDYDPEHNVRIIRAEDGRDVMQVRLPLGIEQYELDGRPDGVTLYNKECVLDDYVEKLEKAPVGEFSIDHDDFVILQNEGILYYYRYLLLFQIGDYNRVARDTDHNLTICELVENYSDVEDDRKVLLQYKPYIIRMNSLSKAMIALREERKEEAVRILERAIKDIESMEEVETPVYQFERIRSLGSLRDSLKQVKDKVFDPVESLGKQLEKAIEAENYERAAELRDEISKLRRGDDQGT